MEAQPAPPKPAHFGNHPDENHQSRRTDTEVIVPLIMLEDSELK